MNSSKREKTPWTKRRKKPGPKKKEKGEHLRDNSGASAREARQRSSMGKKLVTHQAEKIWL